MTVVEISIQLPHRLPQTHATVYDLLWNDTTGDPFSRATLVVPTQFKAQFSLFPLDAKIGQQGGEAASRHPGLNSPQNHAGFISEVRSRLLSLAQAKNVELSTKRLSSQPDGLIPCLADRHLGIKIRSKPSVFAVRRIANDGNTPIRVNDASKVGQDLSVNIHATYDSKQNTVSSREV